MSMTDDVSAIYAVESVTAYHSAHDGNDLYGMSYAAVAAVASAVFAIVDYGEGDLLDGSDDPDVIATVRIQAQGPAGLASLRHGDQLYISGEVWRVGRVRKSADGLEWIAGVSRLSRDV